MLHPATARFGWAVAVAGLLAIGTPEAIAGESVGELLKKLAGPGNRAPGRVEVAATVEGAAGGGDLLVTLTGVDGAKLVADPGVTVTPIERKGLTWQNPAGLTDSRSVASYFASPHQVRLPFTASSAGPVEADVSYAYCIVREQCLFGETRVRAFAPAPASD